MKIRDYFYMEYEKTRTAVEWNEVEKREKKAFELYENNNDLFKEWAKKEGIDLKEKSPYTDYLDVICWAWEFEEEKYKGG